MELSGIVEILHMMASMLKVATHSDLVAVMDALGKALEPDKHAELSVLEAVKLLQNPDGMKLPNNLSKSLTVGVGRDIVAKARQSCAQRVVDTNL